MNNLVSYLTKKNIKVSNNNIDKNEESLDIPVIHRQKSNFFDRNIFDSKNNSIILPKIQKCEINLPDNTTIKNTFINKLFSCFNKKKIKISNESLNISTFSDIKRNMFNKNVYDSRNDLQFAEYTDENNTPNTSNEIIIENIINELKKAKLELDTLVYNDLQQPSYSIIPFINIE